MKILLVACLFFLHVGAAWAQTGGSGPVLNVRTFGAVGNGTADDTAPIIATLAAARAQTPLGSVYLPTGTYLYSGNIRVDSLTVFGDGMGQSVLVAADPTHSSWLLTGTRPAIRDLGIHIAGTASSRLTTAEAVGVNVYRAQDFSVLRVGIGPVGGGGVLVRESAGSAAKPAEIRDCNIQATLADGIHLTAASAFIDIIGNDISHTGDDFIAVVSYRNNGTPCHGIRISDNNMGIQTVGRGIALVGGSEIIIDANDIEATAGAGIYLASEGSYDTFGVTHVSVLHNLLINTAGNASLGHGAIHLIGRTDPNNPGGILAVQDIILEDNRISGATRAGFFIGPYSWRVTLVGNQIANVGQNGVSIGPKAASVSTGPAWAPPNSISFTGEYGVQVDPTGASGELRICGVQFQSVNLKNLSYVDVINIGAAGTFGATYIDDNNLVQPAGLRVERFVESATPVTEALRNTANIPLGNAIAK